jgi:hypothetical protein
MAERAVSLTADAGDGGTPSEATEEYLEQLAAAFRPSWELDDAPFEGSASPLAANVQAWPGGRRDHHATNGVISPLKAVPSSDLLEAQAGAARVVSWPAPNGANQGPGPTGALASPRGPLAWVPPAAADSTELELPTFAQRSRRPLWIALGGSITLLIVLVTWAVSGSDAHPGPAAPPAASAAPLSAAPLSAAPLSAAPLSAAPLSAAPLSAAPPPTAERTSEPAQLATAPSAEPTSASAPPPRPPSPVAFPAAKPARRDPEGDARRRAAAEEEPLTTVLPPPTRPAARPAPVAKPSARPIPPPPPPPPPPPSVRDVPF